MTRLCYYVAQSVDGFIAEEDGGVAFLDGIGAEGEDFGYSDFYAGIDSLVMGRATYDFVRDTGVWHYAGKPTIVMTSRPGDDAPDGVQFMDGDPREVLDALRAAGGRSTWLVGGGRLAASFRAAGLIDEWIVTLIPCVLGAGVPLAGGMPKTTELELVDHTAYGAGVVQLRYRTR